MGAAFWRRKTRTRDGMSHHTYHTPFGNVSVEEIGCLGPTTNYIVRCHGEAEYGGDFFFVCNLMRTHDVGFVSAALGVYTRESRRALRQAFVDLGLTRVEFVRIKDGNARPHSLK